MDNTVLEQRIQRFLRCNIKMREVTLKSEQAFLKLASHISPAQLQVLLAIGEHPECTMSQLAQILHFSQANITQMVDRMIVKKLLARMRSEKDRRIVLVGLSPKGKKIFLLHQEHIMRTAKEWFTHMNEQEQEWFLSLWEKYLF